MKGKWKNIAIAIVIVGVLALPIVYDYYAGKEVDVVNYNQYGELAEKVVHGKTLLVYYGDPKSKDFEDAEAQILEIKKDFKIDVAVLDFANLTEEEKGYVLESRDISKSDSGWILLKNQTTQYIHDGSLNNTDLDQLINKYHNGIIPADEINYKVAESASAYKKAINGKEITMTVFGRTTCSWCRDFKPIYNELAAEKDLNIYSFDYDTYDEKEYQKIMDFGLTIPKECTQTGTEAKLADGFGTPLTLFTQKGKVIGCISGYLPRENLILKLESVGML